MKLTPNRIAQLKRDADRYAETHDVSHTAALKAIAAANGFANWDALKREAGRQGIQLDAKRFRLKLRSSRSTSVVHAKALHVPLAGRPLAPALEGGASFTQNNLTAIESAYLVHRSSDFSSYYTHVSRRNLDEGHRAARCSVLPHVVCPDYMFPVGAIDALWEQFQDRLKKAGAQK